MKYALCEDEICARRLMEQELGRWAQEQKEQLCLLIYESAEELLFKQEEWEDADGLILDIELKAMNGMELARTIRKRDAYIPILFVTGYEQYVFEGYEVGAVSYLMKPVKSEKLYPALERMRRQALQKDKVLLTNAGDENTRIYQRDILYIESDGHYCVVHTGTETIPTRRSIGELREALEEKAFFMPHRSYLVHVLHICKITRKNILMDNGEELPIARGKWEAANQAYLTYYRQR